MKLNGFKVDWLSKDNMFASVHNQERVKFNFSRLPVLWDQIQKVLPIAPDDIIGSCILGRYICSYFIPRESGKDLSMFFFDYQIDLDEFDSIYPDLFPSYALSGIRKLQNDSFKDFEEIEKVYLLVGL